MNHVYLLNPPSSGGSGNNPLEKLSFTNLNTDGEAIFDIPPGGLFGWNISNTGGTYVYIKFYDSESPVLGVDIPVLVVAIPPNSVSKLFLSSIISFTYGAYVFATLGADNSDTTPPAPNQVVGNIFYIGGHSEFTDFIDIMDIFELVPPYSEP